MTRTDLLPLLVSACALAGCDVRPIVWVESRIAQPALVRNVRFNGCVWPGVLEHGKATSPRPCLPGRARVHFELNPGDGQAPWRGMRTRFDARGEPGDELVIPLRDDAIEPDPSAPNAFGH